MAKIPEHIVRLISRELRGKLSDEEHQVLEKWYASLGDDARVKDSEIPRPKFGRLRRRVGLPISTSRSIGYVGWAAAVVIALLWFYPIRMDEEVAGEEIAAEWFKVENPFGVKRTITLADGSTVYLNGGSTLHIHKQFSLHRVLKLEGEAFFNVQPDSLRPFVVHSSGMETQVLGTSFSVRAFEGESQRIAVKTGRVAIRDRQGGQIQQELTVNQAVDISPSLSVVKIRTINPEDAFAWVEGVLVFKQQPLVEVIRELERWYGLEPVDIRGLNKSCRITGTYPQMTLREILESITFATGINYELNGKKLTVEKGNC